MSDNKKLENSNLSEEEVTETVSAPVGDLLKDVVSSEKAPEKKIKESKKKPSDENDEKPKKKKNHKKFKHGMMSTVLTIVFIAVVVMVNVVATVLFEKYPITIDLTSNKVYSISEESEEYVKSIDTDVLITIFAEEADFTSLSTYTKQAAEVMKKYCQYNDRITYRYVDIDSNPDIVADYETSTVSQYDIIVETNPSEDVKRTRKITLVDLVKFSDTYTTDFLEPYQQYGYTEEMLIQQAGGALGYVSLCSQYGYIEASNADQAFISALMTVTDPNPVYVTMLTGRDEVAQLSYLQTLLEANGYTVNTIDITKEEIPEETTIAVMPAPATDYLDAEIEKVDEFLNNDGNLGKQLLYTGSLAQGETPNIDEFLAEYGIEVGEGVIAETSSDYYYQYPYVTMTSDISKNFNQDMNSSNPSIMNYYSRPVKLLFDTEGMIGTEAYIKSTENAYIADGKTGDPIEKGQQIYAAVASKALFLDTGDSVYSNIIVFGSVDTLSDRLLSYSQFQNREYILSLLNGITHKTDGIIIEPKVIEGNVFDINDKQKSVLKWSFILVIPAVVLAAGGIIWLRRKNR